MSKLEIETEALSVAAQDQALHTIRLIIVQYFGCLAVVCAMVQTKLFFICWVLVLTWLENSKFKGITQWLHCFTEWSVLIMVFTLVRSLGCMFLACRWIKGYQVRTDHIISAQRPDTIVLDYKKRCGLSNRCCHSCRHKHNWGRERKDFNIKS